MSKEEKSVLKKFKSQLPDDVYMSEEFLRDLKSIGLLSAKQSTIAQVRLPAFKSSNCTLIVP